MQNFKRMEGGVTAAEGFEAAAAQAGIKYSGRDDMALLFSRTPCVAAGVFTRNVVKAAPVIWDRNIIDSSPALHAVVINAGIANACTGEEGMQYCRRTAEEASTLFGVPSDSIAVASTGVIGMQLPIDRIIGGIRMLEGSRGCTAEYGHKAARAIMTTDTKPKEAAVSYISEGKTITVGGMCKGSGMIHPDMCTMLCFISTDAAISKKLVSEALREVADLTFNMISVDGDTSTNDSVILLANGMAGNRPITEKDEAYLEFKAALREVMEALAKMIAGDGEGCTCLFEVKVRNASSDEDARILAKSVISSSLTKAAIAGHDANWGRILCALGYSGVKFLPEKVSLTLHSCAGSLEIVKNGTGTDYSEELATEILSQEQISVECDMGGGKGEATAWGCDLTCEYVKINGDYRS